MEKVQVTYRLGDRVIRLNDSDHFIQFLELESTNAGIQAVLRQYAAQFPELVTYVRQDGEMYDREQA